MLLRYLISIQVLLIFVATTASAQRKNHFGLDISKTLTYNLAYEGSGIIIEPIYMFSEDSNNIKIKIPIGYCNIKREDLFSNSDMKTAGYYFKPGIGYSSNKRITPFINLLVSSYNIKNKYSIEGAYYGDYTDEYSHSNLFAAGLEPNIDFNFKIVKNISLILSLRLTYIFYNSEDDKFPVYYIPGAGVTNNGNISGGINVYLIW